MINKHYPIIQPYQLNKFIIQSKLHYLNIQPKTTKHKYNNNKLKKTNNNKSNPKPKFFNKHKKKIKPKTSQQNNQLKYIPPHILNKTLHKFKNKSPSSFQNQNKSPITHKNNQTQLTLKNLKFKTSTPKKKTLSKQNFFLPNLKSNKIQNKHFKPTYPSNIIQPSQPTNTHTKKLNPYTYQLYTSILKKKTKNITQ